MVFKNTKKSYGAIAKLFHWIIALIILTLIVVGFYMADMPYSPQKLEIYALHKSFGILILWLVGFRILWRFYTRPPEALETHAKWERTLSKIIHVSLYVAMFAMPLSGWIMSSAGQYPVPFFGFQMPDIVSKNPTLAGWAKESHEIIALLLIAAITLHVLGALKHHFIDKDRTLKSMAPNIRSSIWVPVIFIILIVFGLGVLKFGIINKFYNNKETAVQEEKNTSLESENKTYNPNQWNIVTDQSNIEFTASVYNKNFTGILPDFDGTIIFDPKNISSSKAVVDINLKSVNSEDAERDSQILGSQWFNVADYPLARFETIEFQAAEEGRYVAIGDLSLAGKKMPISFPFTLDIVEGDAGKRAYVTGQFSLNRLDFDLGGEEWKSADSVGHEVVIGIRLVAQNPKNSAD